MKTAPKIHSQILITRNTFLFIGIIFVAFNLRPSINSVGPLISSIKEDIGLSSSLAGFLTTLPLLAFAFLSPLAPKLSFRFGKERTIFFSLLLLGAGLLVRSIGEFYTLFIGTLIMGIGIAFCNVILPSIVKENFPAKIGIITGTYTVGIAIMGGIAPGLSVPLANNFHLGWQGALGLWVVLVLITIVIWLPQIKKGRTHHMQPPSIRVASPSIIRSFLAWQVTLFMGLQSMVFFCFITWIPEILYSYGVSVTAAGWLVSALPLAGIPTNFLIPIIADRLPHQKMLAFGVGVACFLGVLGLLIGGNIAFLTVSIACLGIGTGAALSLSLTLFSLRAANAEQAVNLSGMAQSFGYLLAAAGPIAVGFLFDLFHSWVIPLQLLLGIIIVMTAFGIGAGRNQYIFHAKGEKTVEE